ncbi:MAG: YicC family protein [Firmicutes bacterium]|nr:YicC family protein [Bacillota bacterium]
MVKSMTGFGRGAAQSDNYSIVLEMKAVNHRFLEISCRLPKQLLGMEDGLKKQLQQAFSRGKLDVFVTLERTGAKNTVVKVDKELAMAYYNALVEVASACGLPSQVQLRDIASFSGVVSLDTAEDDEEEIASLLQTAAAEASANMLSMQEQEGAALAADLNSRLDLIAERLQVIRSAAPQVVADQKARLEQRLSELLGAVPVDEARLANELAIFADRVDITEELTRLASHMEQFRQTLASGEPAGRKLNFIQQEMLRETNTIGSKSSALSINSLVIEVKSELEKIREQIQNIE